MARILITGAGRGIGRALVAEARKRGHETVATVRKSKDAHSLTEEFGPELATLVFDVTDHAAVAAAAASLDGPVDMLINNAGIIGPDRQQPLDMDFDGFARTLAVNVLAPLAVTHAFLPHMRRSKEAKIVTISSVMGSLSYQKSDRIAYRVSKAAVNKLMQGLATDLHASAIPVLMLHPGWVRTDMGGQEADISVEESASGILDRAENLTMAQSGRFLSYDGTEIAW